MIRYLTALLSIWFTLFCLSCDKTQEKSIGDNITSEQINIEEKTEENEEEKSEENDAVKYIAKSINNINGLYDYLYYNTVLDDFLTPDDKDQVLVKAFEKILKTEASWSVDHHFICNRLIFAGFTGSESKNDLLRIYNIPKNYITWSQSNACNTILQYKTEAGVCNTIIIGDPDNFEYFHNQLGLTWPNCGYDLEGILKQDIYLLSDRRGRSKSNQFLWVAIKLTDKGIEPYPAFNGKNTLSFTEDNARDGGIWLSDRNFEIPFGLNIRYNVRDLYTEEYKNYPFENDILQFSFDGDKFIGDYDKLNELINLRKK